MATNSTNQIDAVILRMKEEIEANIRKTLTDEVVAEELARYGEKLRATIKPLVDSITIKRIEQMKDALQMSEDLHIVMHWDEPK